MSLQELDVKWREYLHSEACPPVPGLAPLSEDESAVIRQLVALQLSRYQHKYPHWRIVFALLERFPACMAVWLARKAGEAYEAGAFWEKFGELIGITVPMNRRDEFARHFRRAAWTTMTTWLPPDELGGHNIVAQFLHQAGLPLDRCGGFAQHVRKVERAFGLPDIDAADAGEQLREAVLESLQSIPVPTLKRALRGSAGARICEVALAVVLKGDFAGVNPRLGQELERVFEHAGRDTLRRSAQQPFLRLGEDLGSLEIVGPKQDTNLVGINGLTWVVDSRRFPTPRTDEFVMVLTDRPRVVVELAGIVLGAYPPRTFVIRLDDLAEPFMLFDERTRKQRRAGGLIPPGRYWLLHRAADTLIGAEQCYEWPDGERALSLVRINPGTETRLESTLGGPWHFTAALTPFFDASGERLAHEKGEPIYFDWVEMPSIWLPAEETNPEGLSLWQIHLSTGHEEHTWSLSRSDEEAGGMVKCRVESGDFLAELTPGLYHINMTLRRGERTRVEGQAEYWFWQALKGQNAREFQVAGQPHNLLRSECRGFAFDGSIISHSHDQHRKHTLVFDVGNTHIHFHWAQPGVFLESLERIAGQHAKLRSHRLGEAFSANLNSSRWFRIWVAGQPEWEVLVAGQSWQRSVWGDSREFIELSLASLAIAFPKGGDVLLRLGGSERLVARFSSPLQPISLESVDDGTRAGFRFEFSEPVLWSRPVIWELASGDRRSLDGQQIDQSGVNAFVTPDLPRIECTNVVDSDELSISSTHPLTLYVPKACWPEGLWLIELEVRRDDHSEWERVLLRGSDYAPVVVSNRQDDLSTTTRARLLWDSFPSGAPLSDLAELDEEGSRDLFELLAELIELRQRSTAGVARRDMGWLKDSVRSLSKLAGRIALQPQGSALQIKLLNLACQDSSHAGFVYLPGLLALPGSEYRELPSGDPLNDALRLCGRIATADSVAEAVRDDFTLLDMSVNACFANFAQVAATPEGDPTAREFNCFSHERYWLSVLGTLHRDRLAPEWTGESALSKDHLVWALDEFVKRYDLSSQELRLAAANALLHSASDFRLWLQQRLASKAVMSAVAWSAPWPRFEAPDVDFLETTPRFASLFALAARASAAGWLEFDEILTWLGRRVARRWMVEEGIAVLVDLAPELFGHQLLFWELIVRTAPH